MKGAQGREPVSTSVTPGGSLPLRALGVARRSVPWLIWLVPIAVAAASLWFLARELSEAPFRLGVRTNMVWFVVESEGAEIALYATVWQLGHPSEIEEPRIASGDPIVAIRNTRDEFAERSDTPARLRIFPAAGDLLRFTWTPGATPRLTVDSPENPVNVSIERLDARSDGNFAFVAESDKQPLLIGETPSIVAWVGGNRGGQVTTVPLAASTHRSTRVKVSQFGFSTSGNVLVSGVTGGELYFLDLPSQEMKVFRGTDLRISGDSLNVDALAVQPDGLEVTVSGMARSAVVNVGSDQRPHSLMPTQFDRAQRRPWMFGIIGALGVLISLFGLMLAGAAMFERFASWVGASSRQASKQ